MCPKPKTIINVGLSESKITSLQFFNAKRWKDAANEEHDGKIEKSEKKQTKKTASNFDRCCFGERSRALRRTEATWQAGVVFLPL